MWQLKYEEEEYPEQQQQNQAHQRKIFCDKTRKRKREKTTSAALLLSSVCRWSHPRVRHPALAYVNMKMCWKRNASERWMKLFTCASVDSVIFSPVRQQSLAYSFFHFVFFFHRRSRHRYCCCCLPFNNCAFILFHFILFEYFLRTISFGCWHFCFAHKHTQLAHPPPQHPLERNIFSGILLPIHGNIEIDKSYVNV